MRQLYTKIGTSVQTSLKRIAKGAIRGGQNAPPSPMEYAVRNLWRETQATLLSKNSSARLRNLPVSEDLKLHLGSGGDIKPGWINVDFTTKLPAVDSSITFINHDLRRGLPLEENSCGYIYSSHFFEHLDYDHGFLLMRDCHKALRPGGIFRVALPTFENMFRAYVSGDEEFFDPFNIFELFPRLEPGTQSLIDHVNYGVYQYGEHKCLYDEAKVVSLLRMIGYSSVASSEYKESVDPPDPIRRRYSFYVEAVK